MNSGTDAIYFLSPQQHIAECLVVDLEVRRYRSAFLLWTGLLDPKSRRMVEGSNSYRSMVSGYDTMMVDFFPRESHLVTFRDPWSFPVLYHPSCNNLVQEHMRQLAQKVRVILQALGKI
jgi:syntaxin-binding protein 1